MRNLDTATSNALGGSNVPCMVFVQIDFDGAPLYVCNAGYNVDWNGHTWLGAGAIGAIDPISESGSLEATEVRMTMSGIPTNTIAIALATHYQGKRVQIWFAPLDENYQMVAQPVICFVGRCDTMDMEVGSTATVTITAQSRLADWDRPRIRRYNAEDQKARYPNDKGFEFVPQIVEKEIHWGRA